MPTKRPTYAVLMGDIVASEQAPSRRETHRVFNKAIARANKRHAEAIASPLTITLGDEFQGLLTGLAKAWDLAAELRLALLSDAVPCRFVLGAATLDTPLNPARAWNMMGEGLARAREKLDDKRSANAFRFSFPDDPVIEPLLDAAGDALTQTELGWTETQRRYFHSSRGAGRSIARIAKDFGVSERSVYKVLNAAHADFHGRQSEAIRQALTHLDKQHGLT